MSTHPPAGVSPARESSVPQPGREPGADCFTRAFEIGRTYSASRAHRPVFPSVSLDDLRAALSGPLPEDPIEPAVVIEALARGADPGLVTTTGPRYFGFVTGGALPAAAAAEWLVSAWDQNAGLNVMSPAAAVVEEVAAAWLLQLLGLPSSASVGFVSGCGMANATALAAARHELLRRAGWDVEARGLNGSPPIHLFVGEEVHVSVLAALRLLGFGAERPLRITADGQGRMMPQALADALATVSGPVIVCAQSGNVNTGAFDPLDRIAPIVRNRGGHAGSRSMPRCARWAGAAWRISSTAAAGWRSCSRIGCGANRRSKSSTTSCSTRCWCVWCRRAAIRMPQRVRRWRAFRPNASAGSAAPAGTGWRRCGSRYRTGRPPTRTSSGPPNQSHTRHVKRPARPGASDEPQRSQSRQ